MDFGKAFTYVFDDPDWLRKVAINALIGLIPIVGQIYLMGWGLEVARRIAAGSATPLPDVDFGTYLGHGFRAFVVSLVYTAPIWVLSIVFGIIGAVAGGLDEDVAAVLGTVFGICIGSFGLIYGLLLGLVLPAALTRSVVSGSISAGLSFRAAWDLFRAAPGAYVMVLLGSIVAGMLASIVGTLACGVGVIFTMAYYQAVMGHFYGQAYLEAQG